MLTREHVIWAYRLLLDRDPENEDVIGPKLAGSRDTSELRRHLMTSGEFQGKNSDFAHTNDPTVVIKELDLVDGPRGRRVRLFLDLSDHVIGLSILRGRYEADEIRFVRRVLEPGDTAIDAGAHVGFFTMQMAALAGPTGRVYAFEPLDRNANLLERSIEENGFGDRIISSRAAVGASSGSARLTFSAETLNTGGAYVLGGGQAPLAGCRTQTIRVVALDDSDVRRPVRFIKMDVEGAEPQALRGAAGLLAEDRPVILSELHPAQLERASGMSADGFLAEVRALGYVAHALEDGRPGPPLDRAPADLVSVVLLPRT